MGAVNPGIPGVSQPGAAVPIRRARLADWRRATRAVRASFGGEVVDSLELLVALLVPWITLLIAEEGDQVIGTTLVVPNAFSSTTWIATVGVIPTCRRRGIARALLLAAEQVSPRPRLRLEVYADNAPALALYAQLSYREVARHAGDGRVRVEMEKVKGERLTVGG